MVLFDYISDTSLFKEVMHGSDAFGLKDTLSVPKCVFFKKYMTFFCVVQASHTYINNTR